MMDLLWKKILYSLLETLFKDDEKGVFFIGNILFYLSGKKNENPFLGVFYPFVFCRKWIIVFPKKEEKMVYKETVEENTFPEMAQTGSFFQIQHKNLLFSSWHAVHIMGEEKNEPGWMIAQILPELLKVLHNHCMLEEDFMILARYPDYFFHQKEHARILCNWRKCMEKDLPKQRKRLLIEESANALSQHISSTDGYLKKFVSKYHFPDEIALLKMYGIRFPASSLFPKKR